ncbi:hypothetical protein, partial [Nocardia thailandica]
TTTHPAPTAATTRPPQPNIMPYNRSRRETRSKRDLFLAAVDRAGNTLIAAIAETGKSECAAAGRDVLLNGVASLRVLLHACSSANDTAFCEAGREQIGGVYQRLRATGHTAAEARHRLAAALLEAAVVPMYDAAAVGGSLTTETIDHQQKPTCRY